ncbi:MAG: GNAT family N-acetyltransferase [Bacteroidetes bacterium]|nr:MAG: GNAT family N-acetyltransferase [Bacteroidota bacterium]
MTDKKTYNHLCEKNQLPVFFHPWWLDIVAPNQWKVFYARKGDEITGIMPVAEEQKGIFKFLKMPVLTPFLGVWFLYPEKQNYHNRLSFEKEVIYQLLEKLPSYHNFNARFHERFTNWLPFYWKGCHQTTRYTYIIRYRNYNSFDELQKQFSSRVLRNVKKALKHQVSVEEAVEVSEFLELNKATFRRQGLQVPYSQTVVEKLFNEGKKRQKVRIFTAYTSDKKAAASVFLVESNQTVYYLMGGISEEYKHTEANTLLFYEVIKRMFNEGKIEFNFEGSMIQSIEAYFRSFGAEQTPYYQIARTPSRILRWYKIITNTYP